ncbi:Lipin/Ned1/Smp2-domain-containing protein, partial [Catenaria anguillulae PL171]
DKWDTVTARVWLWPADSHIVISDVDGTISKSDALGLILPTFGVTYAHEGVARLYSSIAANGYLFVYLTSRGIGQAQATREYIASVREAEADQHLGYQLPDGPVLTSPDGLLTALKREVVTKTPAEFKTATLGMLADLFEKPESSVSVLGAPLEEDFSGAKRASVFAAGFGNRETDLVAYASVGIPDSHQFIVDSSGEVAIAAQRTRPSSPILSAASGPIVPPAFVAGGSSGTALARGAVGPLAPVSKVPSAVEVARAEREYTTYVALATAAKVNRLFPALAGGRDACASVEMQSIAITESAQLGRPTESGMTVGMPEPHLGGGAPGAGRIRLSQSAGVGAGILLG